MVYPHAKWRGVTCPTCGAWESRPCHIIGEVDQPLNKPHAARVRLVDPKNKSLRQQREDELGNRIIEGAKIVGKCIVKVRNEAQYATHAFPEHDPGPIPRKAFPLAGLAQCRRCGAVVLAPVVK